MPAETEAADPYIVAKCDAAEPHKEPSSHKQTYDDRRKLVSALFAENKLHHIFIHKHGRYLPALIKQKARKDYKHHELIDFPRLRKNIPEIIP